MLHPKQIIYPINYLRYFKSFFIKEKNLEILLIKKLRVLFGLNKKVRLLGRARSGIYLAVKILISHSKKKTVLLSPFTIPEIVDLVIYAGGKPLFIDHEKFSTNISIKDLSKKIKKNINCLILTHYHVNQENYKKIFSICKKNNVYLIEDCAISYKGNSKKTPIGSLSDFSIYSFSIFKFVNYFFGGAISYKKKYSNEVDKEISQWKKFSSKNYFKKFLNSLKFSILTNKFIFRVISFNILKFLINKKSLFLSKNSYLDEKFTINSSYFSVPSNSAINEIYKKIDNYKASKTHRQKISKIYLDYLEKISIPKIKNKKNFIKDNDFMHYLVACKNEKHRNFLRARLLDYGYDVGGFFYSDCSKLKRFKKYGKTKNIEILTKRLITLPTHNRINDNYAKKLSKKILEIY